MEKEPGVGQGLHHFSHSTNLMRGLATRRLFRVPSCHTILSKISLISPGFEPMSNNTAISVTGGVYTHSLHWCFENIAIETEG
ncbi:hypothetical protein TNCV_3743071 [Trichonephila clavipes]|nr:hypothetical protein TNCV_3743071 [Trichonephila clavipes]